MPLTGLGRKVVGAAALGLLIIALGLPALAQTSQLITAVNVTGNEYISQDVILADVADLLKIGEPYTAQKAASARQAVLKEGYFDEVTLSTRAVEGGVAVTITVVEKKRITKIIFVGNTVMTDAELTKTIVSKVGHVIDARVIRLDVNKIETAYRSRGYFVNVSDAGVDAAGDLTFVINEAHIEKIEVTGLKRTKKWVVTRQIHTKPGALYRDQDIAQDMQRVLGLGIFAEVVPDPRPGEQDPLSGVIVDLKVKEKPTGLASVAAAYSNLDNFVLMLSVQDSNLRGRAERGAVDLELFGRTSYDVRFTEPFLDRKNTVMDLAVFDSERKQRFVGATSISLPQETFDERRTGASVKFTRPLSATTRVSLSFRSEDVSTSFLEATQPLVVGPGPGGEPARLAANGRPGTPPDNPDLDPDVLEPGDGYGPIIISAPLHPGGRVSAATLGWTRDSRRLAPNRTADNYASGQYLNAGWEAAGSILGGSQDFNQLTSEFRLYRPLGKAVAAFRVMGGTSMGDLPLFESFSVGGANTLRGYDEERFRGKNMLLANLEYRYSISDKFGAVAFVDAGDAFGGVFRTIVPGFEITPEDDTLKLHVGAGVGLRADTPLGAIRLDFGFGSEGSQVHFGFGQMF